MRAMQSISRLRPTSTFHRATQLRAFSGVRVLRIKEGADRSPEELEKQKQKNLQNNEKNRELASGSEEVVDAEQDNVKDDQKHMEKLQKETAQKSEENHPHGKS